MSKEILVNRRNVLMGSALAGAIATLGTPAYAAGSKPKTTFGFTIAPPKINNVADAYKDLENMRLLGVKDLRMGFPASEVVDGWGDNKGTRVRVKLDVVAMYSKFLRRAKALGMKVTFLTVEGYIGDVSYDFYIKQMREYWKLLASRLSRYVDVWQVFNEADGLHYRHYTSVDAEPDKDAYFRELGNAMSECRKIVQRYNPKTRITTNLYGYPINDEREQIWIKELDILHPSIDVITVSAYPQFSETEIKNLPERLGRLKKRYNKNVIIGEIGMQTCIGCFPTHYVAGAMQSYIQNLPSDNIESVIFYTLRDGDDIDTGSGAERFGIYLNNFTQKPDVYNATKNALTKFNNSK